MIPVGDDVGEARVSFGQWMAFARYYEDWQVSTMMEALTDTFYKRGSRLG